MVEMVDTPDLKSCAFKRPSSILGEDTSAPKGVPYLSADETPPIDTKDIAS